MSKNPSRHWRSIFRSHLRQDRWVSATALVIVLLISATAALPFLWYGVPQAFDTPIHFARLGALDHALRQGELYPRWLPRLLLGHGYPLFTYYAPASYYLAAAFLRVGATAYGAYSLCIVLFFMVAGAGMYRWARDLYGRDSAAVLAGVAYTISPYMLLNTYVRGAFAELCAQALLPWIFWAFRRLMLAERPARAVPAAALALGALAVTHNITLLFVPVVLVGYLLTLGYEVGFTRNNLVAVGASLLLAMGMSAFFWLPLITEQSFLGDTAYDIARFGWLPGNVWRWDNFMQFNPVFEYDFWGLMQLGIVQVALGLIGFALALTTASRFPFTVNQPANSSLERVSKGTTPRLELWMLLALMLLASALVGAWSLPIWERFRILTLVQFPWRLLVIITLPLALAVGGFTSGIPWRPLRAGVGVLVVALILWANYPRLEHVSFFDETTLEITLDHVAQIEQYKGAEEEGENTSSVQEFKPRWAARKLVLDTEDDPQLTVPVPVSGLHVEKANEWEKEITLDAAHTALLRFNQFYFPGWTLRSNAGEVAGYPSANLGLLTVDLASSDNHLLLEWTGTLMQRIGTAITLLALLALALWCWFSHLRRGWFVLGLGLLTIALVAAFHQPQAESVIEPKQEFTAMGFELVGMRYAQTTPDALALYPIWFVHAPLPETLKVRWQLVDVKGNVVVDWKGRPYYNSYSADNFPVGTLVDDGYRLALPAGLSAGSYLLRGQLEEASAPPLFVSPMMNVADVTLRQPTPPLPTHTNDLTARFEEGIVLNGYDVQPPGVLAKQFPAGSLPVVKSGGIIEVTLWWQAASPLDENYHGFVHLVDINGRPIEQVDQVPGPLFQPPMLWRAERPTPDVYSILIPTDAPSGLYWPWAGLYQFPSRKRLAILSVGAENEAGDGTTLDHLQLAPIKIVNRQTMPRAATKVEVAMGDFAKWVGYEMQTPAATIQPGQSLALTLYYESMAPTPVSYTRFVHVVHPTAGLVTQADAIPQQGANPTWSWQRGEIIADPVTLTFPPDAPLGEYQLLLGFYAPEADNVRLSLQSDDPARVQQENQAVIVSVIVSVTVAK